MLTCSKVLDVLDEYYDRQLDHKMMQQVEGHLNSCGECMRELDALKAMSKAVASVGVTGVAPDFTRTLHNRLVQAAQSKQQAHKSKDALKNRLLHDWRVYTSVAACVLILFIVSISMPKGGDHGFEAGGNQASSNITSSSENDKNSYNYPNGVIEGASGGGLNDSVVPHDDTQSTQNTDEMKVSKAGEESANLGGADVQGGDNRETSTDRAIDASESNPSPTIENTPTPSTTIIASSERQSGSNASYTAPPTITPTPASAAQATSPPTVGGGSSGSNGSSSAAQGDKTAGSGGGGSATKPMPSSSHAPAGSVVAPTYSSGKSATFGAANQDVLNAAVAVAKRYGTVQEYDGGVTIMVAKDKYSPLIKELSAIEGLTFYGGVDDDSGGEYRYILINL